MTRSFTRLAGVAALSAIVAAMAVAGANASSLGRPFVLRGTQITVDEAQGKYRMEGSLIGDWQTTSFTTLYESASQFAGAGTELFTGCHDLNGNKKCEASENGTIKFTFTYWATFEPTTGALIKGQCVHPIVGGSGAFKNARGVIYMKDTPTATGVVTVYSGTLLYPSSSEARTTASRSLSSSQSHHCGG